MATTNPFDLLGDDDNDDPSQLIAAQQQKLPPAPKKTPAPPQKAAAASQPANLPSKPLPPAQAVKEAKSEAHRGGGRGGGRGTGRGHGGRGFNRDSADNENNFGSNNGFSGGYRPPEDGDAGKPYERRGYGGSRGGFRGGRRGGLSNGVGEGERPRRVFERHSGTGHGNDFKRDGAGRGNWGTPADGIATEVEEPDYESEKKVVAEKQSAEKQSGREDVGDASKENPVNEPEGKEPEEKEPEGKEPEEKEPEEKEPEDKEMTLEEYEKVRKEKRKALLALKSEERKVDLDKDFESMQLLSNKKKDEDVFIKLGSEKDKRKEAAEKEERVKKSVSINEFLKPAEGERSYGTGGRGRGRGRGSRGGFTGNYMMNNVEAPSIQDVGQFPSLGAK